MTAPAATDRAAPYQRSIRWRLWIPATVLVLLVLVAIFAQSLAPMSPIVQDFGDGRLLPPGSPGHLLGTDLLARDELSRLIVGTQMSLLISFASVTIGVVVGLSLGIVAGFSGGWIDVAIMRVMDSMLAFPTLILALIISVALGSGVQSAIIAIAVVSIPGFVRLARSQTLRVRQAEYVAASRVIGTTPLRIVLVGILPNIWRPCAAQAALTIGFAIPAEATLSFLGLGVQLPTPSWGNMIGDAYSTLTFDYWLVLWPVAAIMITALSASLMADALSETSAGGGGKIR